MTTQQQVSAATAQRADASENRVKRLAACTRLPGADPLAPLRWPTDTTRLGGYTRVFVLVAAILFAPAAALAADPGPIAAGISARCSALLGMAQFSEADTPLAPMLNQTLAAAKVDLARLCAEIVTELQAQCPGARCRDARGEKPMPPTADRKEGLSRWRDRLPGTWRVGDDWNLEVRPRGSTPNQFEGELGATVRDPEIQRLEEMSGSGRSDYRGWGEPTQALDPRTQRVMDDLMQQLQNQIRDQVRPRPQPQKPREDAPAQPDPFQELPDILAPPPPDASSSLRG